MKIKDTGVFVIVSLVVGVLAGMTIPFKLIPNLSSAVKPSESGTITLNQIAPRLGDNVTFTSTYQPKNLDNKYPGGVRIQVVCHQNGVLTYGMAGHYDYVFLLGGGASQWLTNGGPANCQADLYYWSYAGGQQLWNPLASTTFDAGGKQ